MKSATYFLFIFLLIFSPLAFGTVEQWSLTLMEGLSFFALTLYFLERLTKKKPIYHVPGLIPLVLFLCYLLLQLVPLPGSIINLFSPETFKIYQDSILILDSDAWLSFSVNKKATLKEFFRYSAYVCFYCLTIQILTDKKKLKQTVNIVITFLSVLSIFAIIQKFTSTDTIYWLLYVPNNSIIFGPYVNHNHFAGLVEMGLPIALSLFLYLKPQTSPNTSLRQRIIETFDIKKSNVHILMGFSTILLMSAIVLSLSRGALISISLALIIFVILFSVKYRQKRTITLIFVLLAFVVLSISWFGWGSSFERFAELKNNQGEIHESRIDFWKDSILIIKDFPLTGVGFGNFAEIYPRYRTLFSHNSVLHSHNDYIELFIEGGLIGFLLVGWFLIELFYRTIKRIQNRHYTYSTFLFLGCVTGIVSILIHSFIDFNLHIGANGLFYFFLLGLLVSTANTKIEARSSKKSLLKTVDSFWIRLLSTKITFFVLVISLVFNVGIIIGQLFFDPIENINLNTNTTSNRLRLARHSVTTASYFDPLEGKYQFALANLDAFQKRKTSLDHYKNAISHFPLNSAYLQRVGLVLAWFNQTEKADKLLQSGISKNISNPESYKVYADWLLSNNNRKKSKEYIKKAISLEVYLDSRVLKEYISLMLIYGFNDDDINDAIPKNVKSLMRFGDYLNETGRYNEAENTYVEALTYINDEGRFNIWDFSGSHRYYLERKRYSEALTILLLVTKHLPDSFEIRIRFAETYERLNDFDKAIEEYYAALAIDPGNSIAQEGISRLKKK